ncbi:membrane protein [Friedmanniella endophytica]|uniref:Membrane protein n=1 Tax=Microlunatus kandeliicorticis TaxID=1759536 RepID=A0A7W3ITD0_9ACTN|nr:YihY/virulence factor BrkB family protein [Microlunatus kandeliicorticis]MBA8794902.1 membrane protein [Microlunatus kandeliicorticis]
MADRTPHHGLRSRLARVVPAPVRRVGATVGRMAAATFTVCFRYRVTGLAAEAAFFAILSLPPLIFGLAGAIGFVASQFRSADVAGFQTQILSLASRVLNPSTVEAVLAPTLSDVLTSGRYSVISIGFVLALWSGSRALNVFFDTITIMYGQGGVRNLVRTRALSFVSYVIFLLLGVVLVPLVLAGPSLVARLLPRRLEPIGLLYWPVMVLGSVLFLIALYRIAVPARTRWRGHLPGAALSLAIWVGGSVLLRYVLGISSGSTTIYGPLAAPIAILIWLYVMSLAVLIGAALNSAVATLWPAVFGHGESHEVADAAGTERAGEDAAGGAEPAGTSGPDPEAAAAIERLRATDRAVAAADSPLEARLAAGLAAVPDTRASDRRPKDET